MGSCRRILTKPLSGNHSLSSMSPVSTPMMRIRRSLRSAPLITIAPLISGWTDSLTVGGYSQYRLFFLEPLFRNRGWACSDPLTFIQAYPNIRRLFSKQRGWSSTTSCKDFIIGYNRRGSKQRSYPESMGTGSDG